MTWFLTAGHQHLLQSSGSGTQRLHIGGTRRFPLRSFLRLSFRQHLVQSSRSLHECRGFVFRNRPRLLPGTYSFRDAFPQFSILAVLTHARGPLSTLSNRLQEDSAD